MNHVLSVKIVPQKVGKGKITMKEITIEHVHEHYVIRLCGSFYATAETYIEALEEVAALEAEGAQGG